MGKKPTMLVKVLLICNTIGLAKLARHIDHHGYHDVPMHGSKAQSHQIPTDLERTLLQEEEGSWEAAGRRADVPEYPVSIAYPHQGEREQLEAVSPPSQNG